MRLAQVLLNSNVFYWYSRAFGDGFLLGTDILGSFPIPDQVDADYVDLALRLDSVLNECTTFQVYRGERVPSYNFNTRMDLLLDIDAWILRHVAPDLDVPANFFAQSKSNSFLHTLDVTALIRSEEVLDPEVLE